MDWARDIPCRNIIIYGYCKKEKEGCPFRHESEEPAKQSTLIPSTTTTAMTSTSATTTSNANGVSQISSSTISMPKFNAKVSASFTPMSSKSNILSDENNLRETTSTTTLTNSSLPSQQSNGQIPPLSATGSFGPPTFNPYATESFTPASSSGNHASVPMAGDDSARGIYSLLTNTENNLPGSVGNSEYDKNSSIPGSAPMDFKFLNIYPPPHSLLQYHLYAPDPPPHLKLSLKPNERTPESLFIPNDLREQLLKKNLASLQVFPPGGAIPTLVQEYFNLVPLDFNQKVDNKESNLGHENTLYKVFSNTDGNVYLLRRIHNVKIQDTTQISRTFQSWKSVQCSNVVKLVDLFQTTKFNDSSLCAIYDYYPLSSSLYEAHFVNFPLTPITQEYLWSYLVQLVNALNAVHSKGLAINILDWHKVIVTGSPGRIKITGCGPFDVLNFNANRTRDIYAEQQQNFVDLGLLLKDLSSKMSSIKSQAIDDLAVEDKFKTVIKYLLDEQNKEKTIKDLSHLFYDKMLASIDSTLSMTDYTEGVLSRELENGRLFRLICKLNFIYGRMESRIDIDWSESGGKFPIVLFYDFVFHQVDSSGKNIIDLTHVLRSLNKLDAGVSEKIVLATPDEMNCIIISYQELRDLIDSTFRLLLGQ